MRLRKYENDAVAGHGFLSGPPYRRLVAAEYRTATERVKRGGLRDNRRPGADPEAIIPFRRAPSIHSAVVGNDDDTPRAAIPASLGRAITGAVEAMRAVLRDADDDDVPSALRRVAGSSARRLPPPLQRALLAEAEVNPWLRSEALERLPGDADAASRRYLERPDGWWLDVAAAVADATVDDARRSEERQVKTAERLAAKADEAKARTKAAKAAQRRAEEDAKALRRDLERVRRAAQRAETAPSQEATARIDALVAALDERRRDHQEAEATIVALTTRVRELRKALAAARRLASVGDAGHSRDPVVAARALDLAAAAVPQRTREAEPDDGPVADREPADFRLPPGVSPDDRAAVDWLVGLDRPFTMVVDGYNLLFHLAAEDFTSGRARLEGADWLDRLAARCRSTPSVIMVFDSDLAVGERTRRVGRSVEMRFTTAGRSADEEVVALAADLAGPVVVVSSDREVIGGADAAGALVLWSEALARWRR